MIIMSTSVGAACAIIVDYHLRRSSVAEVDAAALHYQMKTDRSQATSRGSANFFAKDHIAVEPDIGHSYPVISLNKW